MTCYIPAAERTYTYPKLHLHGGMNRNGLHYTFVGEQRNEYIDTNRYVCSSVACGDGLLTLEEIASLCGFEAYFEEYVPVFLAGKNVYRTIDFKREGVKN